MAHPATPEMACLSNLRKMSLRLAVSIDELVRSKYTSCSTNLLIAQAIERMCGSSVMLPVNHSSSSCNSSLKLLEPQLVLAGLSEGRLERADPFKIARNGLALLPAGDEDTSFRIVATGVYCHTDYAKARRPWPGKLIALVYPPPSLLIWSHLHVVIQF